MLTPEIMERAAGLVRRCAAAGLKVATVESCTGGLLSAALTSVPGASDVFERGYVTYSDAAKTQMVGVPRELVQFQGAVSEAVAGAMAEGALRRAGVDIAVAITGVAGPGGGSAEKPVGLVHFAAACKDGTLINEHRVFPGDRAAVRAASVDFALALIEHLAG